MSNGVSRKSFGAFLMKYQVPIVLPKEVYLALHIEEKGEIFEMFIEDGRVILEPKSLIPEGEEWFWTEEWQAGEREAQAEIEAGKVKHFDSMEEFLTDLGKEDEN